MPFVDGYKHDIFVSYAHVDNQIFVGANKGWVTALIEELKISLSQLLGRLDSFSLWMDPQLPGNKPLTPAIIESLQQSAILLIVLSPGYLASEWCLREMNTFLDTVQKLQSHSARIFLVERLEVERSARPPELADLLGYKFWSYDDDGKPRTLSVIQPEYKKELYNQQVNKLAYELGKEVKGLKASTYSHSIPKMTSLPYDEVKPREPTPTPRLEGKPRRVEPLPGNLRNPNDSIGLFVGVGEFDARSYLSRLRYAPDDAVALAHLFVNELELISPKRARIALGGKPTSLRALQWLDNLKQAEVTLIPATRTELLYAIHEMADLSSKANGVVIMSFSTHGYMENDIAYLMPADGSRRFTRQTGLELDMIYTTFGELDSLTKKILVIDACRVPLEGGMRGQEIMSREFEQVLKSAQGLALLSSCGVGQSSWESPHLEQGVFTHFLLQGLQGDAPSRDEDGLICLENAFAYALASTNIFVRQNIKVEQLPWYGGEEFLQALPLAVSTMAKQRAEQLKQYREELNERKERALRYLVEARLANRSLISLITQGQVERELEILEGVKLEELLDNVEKLADKKASSCKLFVA